MEKEQMVVLTVDDNPTVLTLLNEVLSRLYKVYPANSGERALHFLEKRIPDIILLDLEMPGLNGYEVLQQIKENPRISHIPVVFLTGREDPVSESQAFEFGAIDFIHKPINKIVLLSRVKLHLELESYKKNLEHLVFLKTSQVTSMQETTLKLLAQVTDFRDKETGSHILRTSAYVCAIMDNLFEHENADYRIDQAFYDNLKRLSPLHDIGKVSIPDHILLKPGRLLDDEFEIMKTHVLSGAKLLKEAMDDGANYDFLFFSYQIVISHHEKWDGTGYPFGLKAEEIPLAGRIMAIADVYDALTTERPYKSAFSHENAIEIMTELRGKHFDPTLLDIFLLCNDEILKIKNGHSS